MGESTCLMHSLSEPINNNHGNNLHVLGDSVSFGRFTSESLAWEKWSTFPHKRYVEEAKSYAQPGSVAQKKAFFEAHYKRVAEQKAAAAAAAALLEQQNQAANSQIEETVCGTSHGGLDLDPTLLLKTHESPIRISNSHVSETVLNGDKERPELLNLEMDVGEEKKIVISDDSKAIDVVGLKKKELLSNKIENLDDGVSVSEDSRTSQMDRPLLKSKLNTDQEVLQPRNRRKPASPSFKSTLLTKKQARIPPSPSKYVAFMHSKKEHIVTPRTKKENIVTPRTKNSTTMDPVDKKRVAPRSLYTLMNSGSVKESCKLNPNGVQKVETKKPVPSAHSTPKRYPTPTRTPSKVTKVVNKQPMVTPSAKRRVETPVHPSAVGSKTPSQKWHIFSAVSKSLSAYRNKLQSPTISTPFTLRTEERAARRKQKLEEKFNEKEVQKVQLQTSLKEKAETEFRKLRQSFCFKARPLPSFYNRRETPKSIINKTPLANPRSLTPSRKPPTTISQPSSIKKSSRRLWKNNDQNPMNHPLSELARRISHENMSPNIPY